MASMKVAAVMATTAAAMKCPGTAAWGPHASAEVTAVADATSCADVAEEIKARASATDGWTDPHNSGVYSVLSSSDSEIETKRTSNPKTAVGGQLYTDKQIFTLTEENGSCRIEACSESQGTSVKDFSTNYCDLRNLYCGSDEGCKTVKKSFSVKESGVKPSFGAGTDKSACIVKKAVVKEESVATAGRRLNAPLKDDEYKCPGSKAWGPHASAKVTAQTQASCSDVAAEIIGRASATGGWTDPHNGGVYSVLSSSGTLDRVIETQRTTNPKKSVGGQLYTDKQIFSLTETNDGYRYGCKIMACSESQGTSVKDFSTNYCDLRNLYCGSNDGCLAVKNDFAVDEKEVTPSFGASADKSACIVKAAPEPKEVAV